jgi:hypothetical protein
MLLSEISHRSNTFAQTAKGRQNPRSKLNIVRRSGRSDGEIGVRVRIGMCVAVRTAGTTGLGTGAKRLIDDGLDGTRAASALGAATEATVNLLGVAGKVLRAFDGTANIAVAKHVA